MLSVALVRVRLRAIRSARVRVYQRTTRLSAAARSAPLTETPRASAVISTRIFSSGAGRSAATIPLGTGSAAWRDHVAPAFRTYRKLNDHLVIPAGFVVPWGNEAWPRVAWGYPLGRHSVWLWKRKRQDKNIPASIESDLDAMQFPWDLAQYKWDHFVLPALRCFYELRGHTDVPRAFVIPEGDAEWPKCLWGRSLGNTVQSIRQKKQFVIQVKMSAKELDALAFSYDTLTERNWRQQILPSFQEFRQEYGHCQVPQNFAVPPKAPWPKRAWGLKLGLVVDRMRSMKTYAKQVARDKDILDELGFVWSASDANWSERILPSLKIFKAVYGHCRVPKDFSVPLGAPWPEQAWGLNLGFVVMGMRARQNYAKQMARDEDILRALGFE